MVSNALVWRHSVFRTISMNLEQAIIKKTDRVDNRAGFFVRFKKTQLENGKNS